MGAVLINNLLHTLRTSARLCETPRNSYYAEFHRETQRFAEN